METDRTPLLSVSSRHHHRSSTINLVWTLVGLWTPVFFGALDGTVVATLLTPIGSYFNKANQSSYLGTSYLLSVAACTPLYGRLSDILGRKGKRVSSTTARRSYFSLSLGAMLLGLFLFSLLFIDSVFSDLRMFFIKPLARCCVDLPQVWDFLSLPGL